MLNLKRFFDKRRYVDRGEGMLLSFSKAYGDQSVILHNQRTGESIEMLDSSGKVLFARYENFVMDAHTLPCQASILRLIPRYHMSINHFRNGVASVSWTLQPDGRYWADEDGFGGTDDREENMYAFINNKGKVILPFQWVETYEEVETLLREKAEKLV